MNVGTTQLASTSRLFSSAVILEMARTRKFEKFSRHLRQSGIGAKLSDNGRVADAFDEAFRSLRRAGRRDEYVYRAALTHNVLLGTHSLATASLLNEFRAGSSKADVVILNGTSTVYEIKSERDTLYRLESQICNYRKVFAKSFVICAVDHAESVLELLPDDVGILTLARWNRINTIREAVDRSQQLCPTTIFDSLQTVEAKKVLTLCGREVPDVSNVHIRSALRCEFTKLPSDQVHNAVVRTLKKTRSLLPIKSMLRDVPKSLMPAILSLRLRIADRERLVQCLNTRLGDIAWS